MANREDNLPWVEKYRPDGLKDVIAHEDIISTSTKSLFSINPTF